MYRLTFLRPAFSLFPNESSFLKASASPPNSARVVDDCCCCVDTTLPEAGPTVKPCTGAVAQRRTVATARSNAVTETLRFLLLVIIIIIVGRWPHVGVLLDVLFLLLLWLLSHFLCSLCLDVVRSQPLAVTLQRFCHARVKDFISLATGYHQPHPRTRPSLLCWQSAVGSCVPCHARGFHY